MKKKAIKFGKDRVISRAFKKKGHDNVLLIEMVPIQDGERLRIIFESVSSPWRQGVWLATDNGITVNNRLCKSVDLWTDTAPKEVEIVCHASDGKLVLYNIWDENEGVGKESQSHTSGMRVEELRNGYRYRCNDFGIDTEFDKLVFRLERVH
jgi:hypothetical protein